MTARVPGKTSRRFPHTLTEAAKDTDCDASRAWIRHWQRDKGPATGGRGQGRGVNVRSASEWISAEMCGQRVESWCCSASYLCICICIWTCIRICSCSCFSCCCCIWHLLSLDVAQLVSPRQRIKVNHLFAGCPRTDRVHCQVQVSSVSLCVCLCVSLWICCACVKFATQEGRREREGGVQLGLQLKCGHVCGFGFSLVWFGFCFGFSASPTAIGTETGDWDWGLSACAASNGNFSFSGSEAPKGCSIKQKAMRKWHLCVFNSCASFRLRLGFWESPRGVWGVRGTCYAFLRNFLAFKRTYLAAAHWPPVAGRQAGRNGAWGNCEAKHKHDEMKQQKE